MFKILTLNPGVDAVVQGLQEKYTFSSITRFATDASFNRYVLAQFDTKQEGGTRFQIVMLDSDSDATVQSRQNDQWSIAGVDLLGQDDNFNNYFVIQYDPAAPTDNPAPASGSVDSPLSAKQNKKDK